MRRLFDRLFLVCALAALPHCGGGAGSFASKDTKETKGESAKGAEKKDQTTDAKDAKDGKIVVEAPKEHPAVADVPLIVSGAYLACADDEAGVDETAVTCRLADKETDKSITLTEIGTEWTWSALPQPSDDVTVKNDGARFAFAGGDAAKRKAFADSTVVLLNGKLKAPVKDFEFFGSKVADAKPGGTKATFTGSAALPANQGSGPNSAQATPTFPPGQDRDKDGVSNEGDKCNNTPDKMPVWATGAWMGCGQGEFLDADDGDLDGVANVSDRCVNTPYGRTVDKTSGSARRGCDSTQNAVGDP